MNPKIYRRQIAEIGIEDMVIDVSSLQKAMETMSKLDELEKVLNQIKFNLRTDIRNLRVEYMQLIQEADDLINQKSLFRKKKTMDDVVRRKKALKKERNTNIAAYEIIENLLNDYLKQIEESRIYIKNHIQMKVK
jgi:predicted NAD/FAD-binding protein